MPNNICEDETSRKRREQHRQFTEAMIDRFVRKPELEQITGLDEVTVWRLEQVGRFPRRRKITSKAVGWLLSEVREWVRTRSAA
jgi:predicted DNA-binding transcriptional regulator AlpA